MNNDKYYPGIFGAIVILLCFVSIELLIVYVFCDFSIMFSNGDPRLSIITAISAGIFFTFYTPYSRTTTYEIFNPTGKMSFKILRWGFFPVVFTTISSYWWLGSVETYLASFFPEDDESLQMLDDMMRGGFFTFFAICIVAPLSEEMLFRGVILRGFLTHYSPLNAILASSVIFGAVHCNIYQAPGAFIVGCFLGWIYYLSRSLWLSIVAHAMFNFIVYVDFLTTEYSAQSNSLDSSIGVTVVSLLATLLGLFVCFRLISSSRL